MPLARWKDLCFDAADLEVAADFWAPVLGLETHHRDAAVTCLRGEPAERTVWVNKVPEAKTVKNRVHLDLRLELEPVLALGARVLRSPDDEISWHVCADPEGNEFCVFDPRDDRRSGFYELVVDTAVPATQAAWWADLLGATAGHGEQPWQWVEGIPGSPFEYWDVDCDDIDELVRRGATVLRRPDDDIGWHVLADPEGNEFCAFGAD
jgi:predicted enzyme related to lactoylglutathione lyase